MYDGITAVYRRREYKVRPAPRARRLAQYHIVDSRGEQVATFYVDHRKGADYAQQRLEYVIKNAATTPKKRAR